MMTDQELIQQVQTAMSILGDINRELYWRQTPVFVTATPTKLTKSPSSKNDPLEFYVSHCIFTRDSEIIASELFKAYKQWCLGNGSLTRGYRPFLDAIAQLGAADGITGVMRGKSYTFRNLALKTK